MITGHVRATSPTGPAAIGCRSGGLPGASFLRVRCGVLPRALAIASLALPALAADVPAGAPAPTPYLAGTCTSCHGTQGKSAGAVPSLAGLPAAYFVGQMKAFRDGTRPATIMHQIAKGYSEQEAGLLAEYFARQAPGR